MKSFLSLLKYTMLFIALYTLLWNLLYINLHDTDTSVMISIAATILISYLWWFKFLKK